MLCSVVFSSALLWLHEASVGSISGGNTIPSQLDLPLFLALSEESALKDSHRLSSLLLLDVTHERPASTQKTKEDHKEVSVTCVIESVWLVPVGEFALFISRDRRLLTNLHLLKFSISTNKLIFL